MADPWSLSIAALALLGQAPSFVETWQKFIEKWRDKSDLPKKEVDESEISILVSRSDWLLYKIMLLDLILAFSKEHTMSKEVLEFCQSERPQVFEEYKQVKARLRQLADKLDDSHPS
jgi:hypothetical protein